LKEHLLLPGRRLGLALVLGGLGGWGFVQLGMPLPWMLGAVCLTMAGALGRLPLAVPNSFRTGMMVVLGVLVGSGFNPQILGEALRWVPSISFVLAYTVVLTGLGMLFFQYAAGFNRLDAFFAGLPGGLAATIFIGAEVGADLRTLSVVHSMRIVTVCFVIPLWIRFVEGVVTAPLVPSLSFAMSWQDAVLLTACGVVGFFVARRIRLPAHFMMGPLLFSGAAHIAGLTVARPPRLLVIAAQVVVGSAIGCRFVGMPVRQVAGRVMLGLAYALLILGVALGCAFLLHRWTGLPTSAMLLALAPGGLPEMTLIALALDVELALVVSHHLVRMLFINLVVPLTFRMLLRLETPPSDG
jgi:hypothetical protein